MIEQPEIDRLNSARETSLFEWALAITVANCTVQIYRLVAQFTTLVFDIFKLSYGTDLFWPLTMDDLLPYNHYFSTSNEIIFKLTENLLLAVVAIYGARCLLNYSILGLTVHFIVFASHCIISIIGFIFEKGKFPTKILSLEFSIWIATLLIEIGAFLLTAIFIGHSSSLFSLG